MSIKVTGILTTFNKDDNDNDDDDDDDREYGAHFEAWAHVV